MEVKLKEIELRLPILSLPKLEILHLSDFHLTRDEPRINKALKKEVCKKDYDFIFLTEDLFDDDRVLDPLIDYLSLLNSRYGTFCVWGNHDKYNLKFRHMFTFNHNTKPSQLYPLDTEKLRKMLSSLNIKVLVDELGEVDIGNFRVSIIGTDDWFGSDRLQNWAK